MDKYLKICLVQYPLQLKCLSGVLMHLCRIVGSWGLLACRQANSSSTEQAAALDLSAVFEDCCANQRLRVWACLDRVGISNDLGMLQKLGMFPILSRAAETIKHCFSFRC